MTMIDMIKMAGFIDLIPRYNATRKKAGRKAIYAAIALSILDIAEALAF